MSTIGSIDKSKAVQKSIRISSELLNKILVKAKEENRSFNNMIETLLIRELK